jgi:uncharacterized protein (DUF58 family)
MGQADYKQLRLSKMQLISKLKLMNIFPGDWESIYKGEGIEFDSTRPFEPGDNPRDIDLFTMAQSGEEDIILRAEERQMKIYIWVDLSGSMENFNEMFFPSKPDIRDIATGLIAYSTCNIYTPLGLCAFDDDIRCFFPARAGADHCDEIINWIIEQDNRIKKGKTDIQRATRFMIERLYRQNIVFFISDFKDPVFEGDFTYLIKPLVEKFDFIPVVIRDPLENKASIKKPISIVVKNNEGDGWAEVYLTPKKLHEIQNLSERYLQNLQWNFHHLGIDCIVLDSPLINDCYQILSAFFEKRKRTRL